MMAKKTDPQARIFAVITRFHKLVRRAGGIPRDKAIENAQILVEKAKPAFDEWLARDLSELSALIRKAERGAAQPGWFERANQLSHQLRDSSGTLDFTLLSFIANSLCEILNSIEAGKECNLESIVCHLDALILAQQKSYRHLKPEQVPDLTRGLHRVVQHVTV
jgi:hypothetical protein